MRISDWSSDVCSSDLNELPPSAKKSSSNPTRSTPNTSANTDATISSTAVTGALNTAASNTGSGNNFRSNFPEALSGNASNTTNCDGTIYDANRSPTPTFTTSTSTEDPTAAVTYATN